MESNRDGGTLPLSYRAHKVILGSLWELAGVEPATSPLCGK